MKKGWEMKRRMIRWMKLWMWNRHESFDTELIRNERQSDISDEEHSSPKNSRPDNRMSNWL